MGVASDVGRTVLDMGRYLRDLVGMLERTSRSALRLRRSSLRVVLRIALLQVFFTGFQAVVPLTIAAVAVGTLVISQSIGYLPAEFVAGVIPPILIREVAPLITMFLLVGRSGTAITIEVATMRLDDELHALEVMNIPFEHYVMLPRLIGMVVSFVVLQVYANVAAVLGGYVLWSAVDPDMPVLVADLLQAVQPNDMLLSIAKVVLFGIVVSITAVLHGLTVKKSRREIPIVTTRAVVRSLLLCFLMNTVLSVLV